MAKLKDHQSNELTKLLLLGDSGSGKTGALASLAEAGYNLRIIDFDNGLDVLVNYLRASKAAPIDGIKPIERVDFETVTDPFKNVSGRPSPDAKAWTNMVSLLNRWTNKDKPDIKALGVDSPEYKEQMYDYGPPSEWTDRDILVIDSLTFACEAAMRHVLKLNARPNGPRQQSDWYQAQNMIEDFLSMLYGKDFKCNVILCAHITYQDMDNGASKAYPNALGKALPPKIGRYVNSMLEVRRVGAERYIHTQPIGQLDLKNTNPLGVLAKYPIATGLASFFTAVRAK